MSYVAEGTGEGWQDLLRWFESTRNCQLHRFNNLYIEPRAVCPHRLISY